MLTKTIESANVTILGNFNPAILRHDFLVKTCGIDLGPPLKMSSPQMPLVSEIKYPTIRWFMDFNRLVIEADGIQDYSEFRGGEWILKYLSVLPHTPVSAAGMNFHTTYRFESTEDVLTRLADLDHVSFVMNGITPFVPVEIAQRHVQEMGKRRLTQLVISYPDKIGDMPVKHLLACSLSDKSEEIRVNFNIETSDVDPLIVKLGNFLEPAGRRSEFAETLVQQLVQGEIKWQQ